MYHFAILNDKEYTYNELKRYFKIFNDHVYCLQDFELCKAGCMYYITNGNVINDYVGFKA